MDKIYSRRRLLIPKLNISIFNQNNNRDNKTKLKILKITTIILIAAFTFMRSMEAIRPIMDKQCQNIAKSVATKISNEQATIVMSRYSYDDLCNVSKDANGNISMISANVITINEIISDVAIKIQEELNKKENSNFKIKLGSLTGTRILSGRGTDINIKLQVIGNLDTDLRSEFEEAGINQTLHRMYLQVECNIIILTPFKTTEERIVNQVLLAEAVIIGTTPNTYYNLEGMDKSNLIDIVQ
ncbi:MAG: sporulation protein YunB [Clostridia bacterium]|nr:sporulation protein YunB [Clostridia bacterium]